MAKKRKLSSFERSFVAARRSGAEDFSFGGKKYSTKQKGEGGGGKTVKKTKFAATPSKGAPTPSAAPRANASVPAAPSKFKPPPDNQRGKDAYFRNVPARGSDAIGKMKSGMDDLAGKRPIPTPTPRPARANEGIRDKARQTNTVGAPATGETTFAKSVHGMENLRKSSKPNVEIGKVTPSRARPTSPSPAKPPQGKVVDYTVNRGASGRTTATAKTARLPDTREVKTAAKTDRLPAVARTTPKTDRLKKKTTLVARKS